MHSLTNIEKYWEYIQENPKRINDKIRTVYSKLVNDINTPQTVTHQNKYTGEMETKTFIFDKEKGQRVIDFIQKFCKHSKGKWAGKPIVLELWQKAFLEAIFGFVDKETGLRKYKKVIFFVAKKNGKSTLSSGIGLYCLTADGEGGAEVYSIAKVKEQAKIVFQEAVRMRNKSPSIRSRTRATISGLFFDKKDAVFAPLASETNSLDGKNPSCTLADEIWAWTDQGLLDIMEDGSSSREQPLLVETSTMGNVREAVFDNEYDYADRIILGYKGEPGGIIDDTVLPIIYEIDDPKKWQDEDAWYQANPGLGVLKALTYMRGKTTKALNNPSSLPNFLSKDLNVRQTNANSWLKFQELNNENTYQELTNKYCIGGCDLSSTTDLTCATLLCLDGEEIKVKQMYFIPEDIMEFKIKEDQIPYDIWEQLGWVRTCKGSKVDYHEVTNWFLEQVNKYNLRPLWIGYDSWSASYWCDEMKQNGFDMVEVRQGAKTFSTPMKQMKADLIDKKINYNNNPILKWCLSNVAVKEDDNENIRPVKRKSRARIDGAVSLLDAYVVYFEHLQEYSNYVRR